MSAPKRKTGERPELPLIASCPSCGRRPSERVAFGWKPEFEGPTTIACSDTVHDDADIGPALLQALEEWMPPDNERSADMAARGAVLLATVKKLRGVA